MKRYDFYSFDEFDQSGTAGEYEALTVLHKSGWIKCDIMTECKSYKTALRRFFKMIGDDPHFEGWYESMREAAENGYFKMNDFVMGNGEKNPLPGYAYEIEELDEGLWYIFLNIKVDDPEDEKPEEEKIPVHGVYSLANCACVNIHIDECGDSVMWRLVIIDGIKRQKWHKAKLYTTTTGRTYFNYGKMRIYLDEVMRV